MTSVASSVMNGHDEKESKRVIFPNLEVLRLDVKRDQPSVNLPQAKPLRPDVWRFLLPLRNFVLVCRDDVPAPKDCLGRRRMPLAQFCYAMQWRFQCHGLLVTVGCPMPWDWYEIHFSRRFLIGSYISCLLFLAWEGMQQHEVSSYYLLHVRKCLFSLNQCEKGITYFFCLCHMQWSLGLFRSDLFFHWWNNVFPPLNQYTFIRKKRKSTRFMMWSIVKYLFILMFFISFLLFCLYLFLLVVCLTLDCWAIFH